MRVSLGGGIFHDQRTIQPDYPIEQMARFNRERITERQPHARGSGAFGQFEVTNDATAYTRAAMFQPGTTTRLLIRFPTVAGQRGSPGMRRDIRGVAIKFYTCEGSYDLVGSDTPLFFVKDPVHFQNFIRSQRRLATVNLRSNDMRWDFWTLLPETAHQVVWLMGDRGLPKTWRHMNLYSSRTCQWINARGQRFWVKYHFITDQGIEFWTQAEADRLAGTDPDYHTKDLYAALGRGEHPSWTLNMQIMPFEEAETYRFNPFDLTKVWPHGDYPLREVGKLTLDRNPVDRDIEIEQAAFRPNNLVPGIGAGQDRMLLARAEDDDWGQAGTLVRDVLDDAARDRLVGNIVGILLNRVTEPVLERAFWYLGNVDGNLGERVEKGVRGGQP
ncbi:MAG: catalase [Trebonia sp.]|jgi:catalase